MLLGLVLPAAAWAQTARDTLLDESDEAARPAVITVQKAGDGLGAPVELKSRRAVNQAVGGASFDIPTGMPLASARLTSRFGMRRGPISGSYRMHRGIDLAAAAGTPVTAPASGVVAYSDWSGGYGMIVALDHGDGVQTRFAHLSRLLVSPGQRVNKGQLLGLVGSTGRSTGPHLHYELHVNGRAVDPLSAR